MDFGLSRLLAEPAAPPEADPAAAGRIPHAAGGQPRRLVSASPGYWLEEALAWSPDGRRFAYLKCNEPGNAFAIECFDLSTGRNSVMFSDPGMRAFCWARDGRVIYARMEGPPLETSSNLWEIRTNPRTAQLRGRRMAFTRSRSNSDVYMGGLESRGMRLAAPGARHESETQAATLASQ